MHQGLLATLVAIIVATAAFYILLNNASGVKSVAGTATGQFNNFAKTARGQ